MQEPTKSILVWCSDPCIRGGPGRCLANEWQAKLLHGQIFKSYFPWHWLVTVTSWQWYVALNWTYSVEESSPGGRTLVGPVSWVDTSEKVVSLAVHLLPHAFKRVDSFSVPSCGMSRKRVWLPVLARHSSRKCYCLNIWRMFPKSLLKVVSGPIGQLRRAALPLVGPDSCERRGKWWRHTLLTLAATALISLYTGDQDGGPVDWHETVLPTVPSQPRCVGSGIARPNYHQLKHWFGQTCFHWNFKLCATKVKGILSFNWIILVYISSLNYKQFDNNKKTYFHITGWIPYKIQNNFFVSYRAAHMSQ